MTADTQWQHRLVSANGARFHVVEAGDGPLVLLLHGFAEYWWAWRHQLPALAEAGYHVVAMDLRGYGRSDKTPRGYDPLTLAADVAGLIRSLGSRDAVVVGHGWGGLVGWTVAAAHASEVRALCVLCCPHPLELRRRPFGRPVRRLVAHVLAMQLPWLPERRIMRGDYIEGHLRAWSAPDSTFPSSEAVRRYTEALAQWPSPHCALEYHRWLFRSRARADGRAFKAALRPPLDTDVLQVTGASDPVVPTAAVSGSKRHVRGRLQTVEVDGAGHYPHEEAPVAVTGILLDWLRHPGSRPDSQPPPATA